MKSRSKSNSSARYKPKDNPFAYVFSKGTNVIIFTVGPHVIIYTVGHHTDAELN